jgi:hypothetical protein
MFIRPLWGFAQDKYRKMTNMTVGIAWGSIVGAMLVIFIVITRGTDDPLGWGWIDVVG